MIDIAQASKIAEKLAGLESLARRVGQSVPEWLEAVWNVLRSGGRDETLKPFSDFAQYTDSLFRDFELQSNHADPDRVLSVQPSEQLSLILETLKIVWRQGGTPQDPYGQSPILSRMQVALLRDVAQAMKNAADGAMDWRLQDKKDPLRLPVLLVFEDTPGQECGCVARLQLQLWHCPGANMGFVQSPSQMCTPTTLRFSQSLETVSHWLRNTITHETVRDYALVWDLVPLQGAYHLLSGASASATFALGGLWLLREFSPPCFRSALRRLQQADFNKLYLSAELLSNGELAVVGGLVAKNNSLGLAREALRDSFGISLPLHVAQNQPDVKLLGDQLPLVLRRHDTLLSVVQSAVARPMNAAQQGLYNALQTALSELNTPPQTTPSPYPLHEPPSVPKEASRWVSALTLSDRDTRRAVSDLAHYALDRWAFRGEGSGSGMAGAGRGGQVHQRFVNLRLKWPRQSGQCESFPSLEHLMAACDPGQSKYDDHPKSAYLVVGEPGSGKTWLMARHEQALCEQFLWQEVHGGDDSIDLPVLPLYLPLNRLPGDQDPVAFFRDWLNGEYPDPRLGLVQLLDANPGHPRFRLRLLLDGLNEIKTCDGVDQTARSKEVVIRLWQAFGRPKLPIVIGVRPGRHWQLNDLGRNFSVGEVLLDRWKRQDIQTYLERRWGQGDARVQKFMEDLPPDSPHEALLGIPLYLNIQCELVEAGAQKLLSNRTHLLAAMLWVRLMQELAKNEGHFTLKGMVSVDEKRIGRKFVNDPGRPPEFPRDGWLLKGLFAQAKAQWLSNPKVDAKARGQVSVLVTDVKKTLNDVGIPKEAWESWFQAVSDLGLGQRESDRNTGREQFQFQHQVFGEWLASQQIFYSGAELRDADEPPHPDHWSREALALLANELAPPQLELGCLEELEKQAREADALWDDPRLKPLFDDWYENGITVEWHDDEGASHNSWREIGVFQEEQDQKTWNFKRMGDLYAQFGWLPRINSRECWRTKVSAWSYLVTSSETWPDFRNKAFRQIKELLGKEGADQAWRATTGDLSEAPPGALDEIVLLAVEALPDPLPWLQQLLKFAKKQGKEITNKIRKEVPPISCWALLSRGLLQEAQRLNQLHQGSKDLKKLRRESAKLLLAVNQALDPELQAQDISTKKPGYDLRHRVQAGLCLGRQGALGSDAGDHIRFERIGSAGQGVRLKRDYWCKINPRDENVKPFLIARYPVTVGEFQAFVQAGGYADENADWWLQGQGEQSAARAWLLRHHGDTEPLDRIPAALTFEPNYNNPLQPMVGLNWYEANAYTHWAASKVYAGWLITLGKELEVDNLTLRLPTEWERVAALYEASPKSWPGHTGGGIPSALLFNHRATGWGRPTPIGSFPASQSTKRLMDACGNQWEWCANALFEDVSDPGVHALCVASLQNDQNHRVLRGGGYNFTALEVRSSRRFPFGPSNRLLTDCGFRLVLAVKL